MLIWYGDLLKKLAGFCYASPPLSKDFDYCPRIIYQIQLLFEHKPWFLTLSLLSPIRMYTDPGVEMRSFS